MNIFRQAKNLLDSKTCGQFTDQDTELINRALFPVINLLPKLDPQCDELSVSEGLEALARIVEEG